MDESLYTEIILDIYKNPSNKGRISDANILAEGENLSCGDQVTFTMKINKGIIEDIKFEGHGCAITTAADSVLTEMVKGKTIQETKAIKQDDLLKELGGIIDTRLKCALLGLTVIKKGIEEYEKSEEEKVTVKKISI